jgi:hypothetical protein
MTTLLDLIKHSSGRVHHAEGVLKSRVHRAWVEHIGPC